MNQNEPGDNSECGEQGGMGAGRKYGESGSDGNQDRAGKGRNSNRAASESGDHSNAILQNLEGTVEMITPEAVIIKSSEGNDVIIEGRAWRFAQEMGYSLRIGQSVNITGYEEDGEFKPVEISVIGSGSAFQFRESSGRPMWAGRGQGKGPSQPGQDI